MTKFAAFMSYAHRDDKHHGGAITKLCTEFGGAVSVAIGEDFEIFQDRKDIAWGNHWPSKLEQGVAGSRFLIAILSPSFFNSPHCRKELTEFLEIEQGAGRNDLILPIYYVPTPLLENPLKRDADPLAKAISQRQYADWRDLRHLPFSEPKVRRKLDSLAQELVQALAKPEDRNPAGNRAFDTPFDHPADTYQSGAFDGDEFAKPVVQRPGRDDYPVPQAVERNGFREEEKAEFDREIVQMASDTGLMEPQAPFISNSSSSLPESGTVFRDIDEPWCPEMVVIPPGSFVMGSPPDEEGSEKSEEPEHRVRFAEPFALGIYPVTFDEFDHFCVEVGRRKSGNAPFGRGRQPLVNVHVEDTEAYLAWLSEVTGQTYCLPSEAMWEYACRAQTITPFSTGHTITADQANYDDNYPYGDGEKGKYREQTTDVGSFPANPFGLFDMHGNVWEWCADHWHDTYDGAPGDGNAWLDGGNTSKRVLRGGSWIDVVRYLRSARRNADPPDNRYINIGFRCARVQETSR